MVDAVINLFSLFILKIKEKILFLLLLFFVALCNVKDLKCIQVFERTRPEFDIDV